jgi:hypothetical protein
MIIRHLLNNLTNFNKYKKGIIILDYLINKIKNIIELSIFNLKKMKTMYKRLKNYKI